MPSPGSPAPSRPSVLLRPARLAGLRRRVLGTGVAALLAGGLVACGGDDPTATPSEPASSATPSESPSESPSASASAPASPSETASATPSETASAPTGGALGDALLGASDVPGLNDSSPWTAGATGPVGDQPFGWCARTSALAVGAQEGVQRTFTSGGDTAAQQVLDVVDETNARRLEQVLRGWHRTCASRGAADRVGPIRPAPEWSGTAWWYLSSRDAGDGSWEALGVARVGSRLTVLRMEHTGQDHSYEPGQDPLERAVAAAAERLG